MFAFITFIVNAVIHEALAPFLAVSNIPAWILEVIGFGSLGPTSGSWAAWYQSSFLGGYIAANSPFAWCQHMAMKPGSWDQLFGKFADWFRPDWSEGGTWWGSAAKGFYAWSQGNSTAGWA